MSKPQSYNLWRITEGQRLIYVGAVISMALMNAFMFGAPLIGKFAIDVVVERDFSFAQPQLLSLAQAVGDSSPYLNYLILSSLLAVLVTALGGGISVFPGSAGGNRFREHRPAAAGNHLPAHAQPARRVL